ncbi:MAG TPA: TetR/AcrR family transcriptional regulator [Terriglobales bacterium]|nr:TetR/AcrR family transcriptional regulator [Terriglobales bacterium]
MADAGGRGSFDGWLKAAYDSLIRNGVDSVRIMPLSQRVKLSRTSFYWFFKDRDALLRALLERWKSKNTANLILQTEAYAESITEAILNVFDCWLDQRLFDSRFEFAVRNWAQRSDDVAAEIAEADEQRIEALKAMFIRFGYKPLAADVRARTIYLTQIGYISMQTAETLGTRMARIPNYVEIFTSTPASRRELDRFFARHGYSDTTSVQRTLKSAR